MTSVVHTQAVGGRGWFDKRVITMLTVPFYIQGRGPLKEDSWYMSRELVTKVFRYNVLKENFNLRKENAHLFLFL